MSRVVYCHAPGSFWRRLWCQLRCGWGHRRIDPGRGRTVRCACGWAARVEDDGEETA